MCVHPLHGNYFITTDKAISSHRSELPSKSFVTFHYRSGSSSAWQPQPPAQHQHLSPIRMTKQPASTHGKESRIRFLRRYSDFLPRAVSRTIELSLQSSFQLSLMVLVCYRTCDVFSLGWSLPPSLGCNPKQPDSWNIPITCRTVLTGLTPSMG